MSDADRRYDTRFVRLAAVVLALSDHAGVRLAEVGFLLILFAGVWLAAAEAAFLRFARGRRVVAGVALCFAGILLIIATHWGHFG